jgi:hypothetical protein
MQNYAEYSEYAHDSKSNEQVICFQVMKEGLADQALVVMCVGYGGDSVILH